jgi:hypothetical protein
MTIKTRFPSIEPSLDLNFAATKRLDPRITFTRASSATFVNENGLIEAAGVNQARFDHTPTTGESLGLLVEESRTNLVPYSEDLSFWLGGGTKVLDPAIADPAGNTGTVYYPSITECTQNFNANGASQIAVSCFVKQRSGETRNSVIEIFQSVTGTIVNLGSLTLRLTGTFTLAGNFSNGTRTEYPNGWYRFTFIVNANAGQGTGTFTTAARIDLEGAASTNYVWGVQVEASSFPTSYIPTTGATATRAADVASITGSNFSSWYRQDEGTFFWSGSMYDTQYSNQNSFRVTEGSNFRGIGIALDGRTGTDEASFVTRSGAGITAATSSIPYVIGNSNIRIGGAFGTDIAASFNGSTPFVASPAYVFGTENKMEIMGDKTTGGTNYQYNGHTRRLTFWPTRLGNEVLQRITQ